MARKELDFDLLLKQALAAYQKGNLTEAERCCGAILMAKRTHFEALHLMGIIAGRRGRFGEAERLLGEAIKANGRSAGVHSDRGIALLHLGRVGDAIESYDRALALKPDFADAHYNRGNALLGLGRFDEALASYDAAIGINPRAANALANRGNALRELGHFEDALASYDQSLAIRPDNIIALTNRGNVLNDLKRPLDALASYDKALTFQANDAKALGLRGNVLKELQRIPEALASYDKALRSDPADAEILCNRGVTLMDGRHYEQAAADFAASARIDPERDYVLGQWNHCLRHCCDWRTIGEVTEKITDAVHAGKRADFPFSYLSVSDSAADQRLCAETYVRDKLAGSYAALWQGERYQHGRIRLLYMSSDFHEHAIAYLTAGLFENHDRTRFETYALSLSADEPSDIRSRVIAAFDHVIQGHDRSDEEVARLIREIEADVVIDLNGHTDGGRPAILARRPAPVQVSYIGLAGTMGAPFVDYIIADPVLVGADEERHFVEKVVRLPETYLVNDDKRPVAAHTPTRAEAGLPETGFVFCSFNNAYKITPEVFGVWMRLLSQVEGSVLWLLSANPAAVRNLRREAESAGVDPDRLVFARRAKPEDHLARHRLADLFLDTLPYNAHTTACDALWTGLPVVTRRGGAFAGRVAASLLGAIGLSELVTHTLADYEALALKLATDKGALAAVRETLARNRKTHPLFDTRRTTRLLESAFTTMVDRRRRGDAPESFAVPPPAGKAAR